MEPALRMFLRHYMEYFLLSFKILYPVSYISVQLTSFPNEIASPL